MIALKCALSTIINITSHNSYQGYSNSKNNIYCHFSDFFSKFNWQRCDKPIGSLMFVKIRSRKNLNYFSVHWHEMLFLNLIKWSIKLSTLEHVWVQKDMWLQMWKERTERGKKSQTDWMNKCEQKLDRYKDKKVRSSMIEKSNLFDKFDCQ